MIKTPFFFFKYYKKIPDNRTPVPDSRTPLRDNRTPINSLIIFMFDRRTLLNLNILNVRLWAYAKQRKFPRFGAGKGNSCMLFYIGPLDGVAVKFFFFFF